MSEQFTQTVLEAFLRIDRGQPKLLHISHDDRHFGNASATLELDGLRFHVLNDRGIECVEIGLQFEASWLRSAFEALSHFKDGIGEPTCPLEALAVANGWLDCDTLIEHHGLSSKHSRHDKDTPPKGPYYSLSSAILLLSEPRKWEQLVYACVDREMQSRANDIAKDLQDRRKAQLTGG